MSHKKILVFNAGPLFPIRGMNQLRIINQIKAISKDHVVDFMFLCSNKANDKLTIKELSSFCKQIISVKSFPQYFPFRVFRKLLLSKAFDYFAYPLDYFQNSNRITSNTIAGKVRAGCYDIVISHYWQASGFLRFLPKEIIKCIDTHYLVEENLELFQQGKYEHIDNGRLGKLLKIEFKLQKNYFSLCDLLIVNSQKQQNLLQMEGIFKSVCIPNGQDLDYFIKYKPVEVTRPDRLLFYGAIGNQFNKKALIRLINHIYPELVTRFPEMKLLIVGSGPPKWLLTMFEHNPNVKVTGYVEDVRPWFEQSFAAVIPLESGSGFRGRTIELMAAGVPVVGTTNALQSVGITSGTTGFVADSDEDIIFHISNLYHNTDLQKNISIAGINYVMKYFSLQATFGRLSNYLSEL